MPELLIATSVPKELIPQRGRRESNNSYANKLRELADYLRNITPDKTILHQALIASGSARSGSAFFGFRGLTRYLEPHRKFREDHPESTLAISLQSIHLWGVEKPRSRLAWFSIDPQEALAFALPLNREQAGIMIVSDKSRMIPSEYYADYGDDPIPGCSFRDIYFGTILLTMATTPPAELFSILKQISIPYELAA